MLTPDPQNAFKKRVPHVAIAPQRGAMLDAAASDRQKRLPRPEQARGVHDPLAPTRAHIRRYRAEIFTRPHPPSRAPARPGPPGAHPLPGPAVESATATTAVVAGHTWTTFGGCNYLGLAQHPEPIAAAREALPRFGLSSSASRETTGHTSLHAELERRLAAFFESEAALLVPDGYTANIAAMQTLAAPPHPAGRVVLDRLAHRSLADATATAGMHPVFSAHLDVAAAANACAGIRRPVFGSDGVFCVAGSLLPIPDLLNALPHDATLVVDECHAFTTLGPGGRGSVVHFEAHRGSDAHRVVRTCTLAKGLGCHGGVLLGSAKLIEHARRAASVYVGTTPVAPPIAAGAIAALDVLEREPQRVARVQANARRLGTALAELGLIEPRPDGPPTPIFAFAPEGGDAAIERTLAAFERRNLLIPAIGYPGGPAARYFRVSVTSEHTPEQIATLVRALAEALDAETPDAALPAGVT